MKLILKITAGILIAWGLILVTSVVLAFGTAKVVSDAIIQPAAEQMNSPIQGTALETVTDTLNGFAEPFEQMATEPTQTKKYYWLDVDMDTCSKEGGIWGYNYAEAKLSCQVTE
jgi:hypothetical protein